MKYATGALAAALAWIAATPASATSGMSCTPVSGAGPGLGLVVGHGVAPVLVAATIRDGRRLLSTAGSAPALAIAQSWIDGQELRVDLVDRNATRFEGRLRARFAARGRPAVGTFSRNGRIQRVRCVES
jgi:hypothetical protein